MEEALQLPHKLTLQQRESLNVTGVTEVVSFDDGAIILKTNMGELTVQGEDLQLKNLSLEGGQVAVKGHIQSLVYEESKPAGRLRRFFG